MSVFVGVVVLTDLLCVDVECGGVHVVVSVFVDMCVSDFLKKPDSVRFFLLGLPARLNSEQKVQDCLLCDFQWAMRPHPPPLYMKSAPLSTAWHFLLNTCTLKHTTHMHGGWVSAWSSVTSMPKDVFISSAYFFSRHILSLGRGAWNEFLQFYKQIEGCESAIPYLIRWKYPRSEKKNYRKNLNKTFR